MSLSESTNEIADEDNNLFTVKIISTAEKDDEQKSESMISSIKSYWPGSSAGGGNTVTFYTIETKVKNDPIAVFNIGRRLMESFPQEQHYANSN